MGRAGGGASDHDVTSAMHRHAGRPLQRPCEEPRRRVDRAAFDDHDIEHSVLQRRHRRNARVVAVLAGIGDGNQQRARLQTIPIDFQFVILGRVRPEARQPDPHIGSQPTYATGGELLGNPRVESDPHRADERNAVHARGVDRLQPAASARGQRPSDIHGHAEVAGEAVAGAGGDNAQGDLSSDEPLGHFVNGAVAADSEYDIERLGDGRIKIASGLAFDDFVFPLAGFADDFDDVAAPLHSGAAVHDEESLHTIASRWRSNHAAQNGSSQPLSAMYSSTRRFGGGAPLAVEM